MRTLAFIVHNIRSAHNVGAILRSADGIGIAHVYLTGYTPSPADGSRSYTLPHERMIAKTALGAEKTVSWSVHADIFALIKTLRHNETEIIGLERLPESIDYRTYHPQRTHGALILGNEPEGISSDVRAQCDALIQIPMRGVKTSLNVSVAAAVAGYALYDTLQAE